MDAVADPKELQQRCLAWKKAGCSVSLVPTMGFFHAGHKALMEAGRKAADKMVVSLFVNPAQFGPTEDLTTYPRDPEGDAAVAEAMGADILFTPTPSTMYLPNHTTWVDVDELGKGLCGRSRPMHFRGVTTVVIKLFMLTQPDAAFFGEKDRQQLAIIRRMVRDLTIPVTIVGVPTVREADGLALSSRNAYLTPAERAEAPHLQKGLRLAEDMVRGGERNISLLDAAVRAYWKEHFPSGGVEYLEFVHPDSLACLPEAEGSILVAAAVKTGRARLIDNRLIAAR